MTGVDVGSIVAMVPADSGVEQPSAVVPRLDPDSAGWLQMLAGAGPAREAALAQLHGMLVRIARGEAGRRAPRLQLTGPELDDLAHQAAADALIAITSKLGQFRGESRFTTWAYKFVIFEVSAKIGRHFWRHPAVPLAAEDWDRLPGYQQERLKGAARRYPQMQPIQKERFHERIRDWAAMTPEQRREAREAFQGLRRLPPQQQHELRERWLQRREQGRPPEPRR